MDMEDTTQYPKKGAVIYAGNNSLLRVACHREHKDSRTVIGYEKLRKHNKETCEVKLGNGTSKYTMVRIRDGEEYVLYGPTKMHGASQKVFSDLGKSKQVGYLRMENEPDGKGGYFLRSDSRGMFRCNAEALRRAYSGTVIKSFANVHDDGEHYASNSEAKSVTREHFLDTMGQFEGTFDFFAYCGHGYEQGLSSACIGMDTGYHAFVTELWRILKRGGAIIFYACLTGAEHGFAQQVSRDFPYSKVFAHLTAKRGDNNPDTVVIENGKRTLFEDWLGKENFRKWKHTVTADGSKLYLQFPWMSEQTLLNAIGATTDHAKAA
jgi:hypothetical protein